MMQWIRTDSSVQQPVFIRRFSAHCVLRAVLEITGLGIYRAELNGKRVGNDYLTPGWNDYDAYVRFQTYDVTALLETENELRVTLGEGWYMGRLGMSSGASTSPICSGASCSRISRKAFTKSNAGRSCRTLERSTISSAICVRDAASSMRSR